MSKTFRINIPITKIDEEQRIVTGIATTEALDSQGDIVDYEASKKAFSDWPGNIREMHGNTAVGKGIDTQFDDVAKTVTVSAKISESADGENAWIKVKEQILTGFSIGGRVFEVAKDKAVEGANRILDYTLSELSLVDNPANPEAELIMVKSATGGKLQRVEEMVKADQLMPTPYWAVKFMGAPMKKSVYDAAQAINLATELAYLIMSESWEDENDAAQLKLLTDAFNNLKEFTAQEVVENDDYLGQAVEVMELARKAIDLRKGKLMSEVKKAGVAVVDGDARNEKAATVTAVTGSTPKTGGTAVPKKVYAADGKTTTAKTNVVDGIERDINAEVVADETPAIEEVPVETPADEGEKIEVKTDADKTDETVAEAAVETPVETPAPGDIVTPETAPNEEEKAASSSDLLKSVQTLLTKLNDSDKQTDLKKVTDVVEKLSDKVEKSIASLEDRIATLEKSPVPTKGKQYHVIDKGGLTEVDPDMTELLKRQDYLAKHPQDADPGEMEDIYKSLRKANTGERITIK